jgi:hypothetical protein
VGVNNAALTMYLILIKFTRRAGVCAHLVINRQTAKVLGLTVRLQRYAFADEVID